jgi:hypothetical protein
MKRVLLLIVYQIRDRCMEYPKIETLYERDEKTHKIHACILKNRVYDIIKSWHWTEKIDGTNIRLMWDGISALSVGGKTDNAQISADLIKNMNLEFLKKQFVFFYSGQPIVVYGEGYGAGIQKGGIYSLTKKFIVFDILVEGKWWLNWENTCDVASKLCLDTVPYKGEMTLDQATDMVRKGFPSSIGLPYMNGTIPLAEGLVGRTVETLFDKKGSRLIVKLKTKDF